MPSGKESVFSGSGPIISLYILLRLWGLLLFFLGAFLFIMIIDGTFGTSPARDGWHGKTVILGCSILLVLSGTVYSICYSRRKNGCLRDYLRLRLFDLTLFPLLSSGFGFLSLLFEPGTRGYAVFVMVGSSLVIALLLVFRYAGFYQVLQQTRSSSGGMSHGKGK